MACSPDAYALLNYPPDSPSDFAWISHSAVCLGGNRFPLACVERKKVVSHRSLDAHLHDVCSEMQMMHLSSPELTRYVLKQHSAQITNQLLMTRTNFGVYLCASEVGVVFTRLLYCPTFTIDTLTNELIQVGNNFLSWAYTNGWEVPVFADAVTMKVCQSRLSILKEVEKYVGANQPMRPVRLVRHGLQAAYSRTKRGVDCAAQYRPELDSSGASLGWEQKLFVYFFNTILVNSFTSWCLLCNEHLLQTRDVFESLDRCRGRINRTSSFADYTLHISKELLQYAHTLDGWCN